jgi:hypothetical protein
MKFILILGEKGLINEKTKIGRNQTTIKTELEICSVMKRTFFQDNDCKSFQDWADKLNETKEFDGEFTYIDAIDNLSNCYNLNINGKYVDIYELIMKYENK